MKTFKLLSILITFYFVFAAATEIAAQETTIFTTGLQAPTKIITAGQSSLLVAETGTAAPNTSRISIVDRETGARYRHRRSICHGDFYGQNNPHCHLAERANRR